MKKFIILLFIIAFDSPIFGQTKEKSEIENDLETETDGRKTGLTFENEYLSRVAFQGRDVGGEPTWGNETTLTFHTSGGFSAVLGASFWQKLNPKGVAQFTTGVGYDFDLTKNLSASLGFEHWFYNFAGTLADPNPLNNFLTATLVADFDPLSIHADGNFLVGKNDRAWGFDFGLTGKIVFENGRAMWLIEPDATAMSGTDNRTILSKGVRGKPILKSQTIYKILNYDFTLPVTYTRQKWSATAAFHYELPQNPSDGEGTLVPFSYFSLGFSWIFYQKK